MADRLQIKPAQGKLAVLTPGMGAVSSTFCAGLEAVRRGLRLPIGSLTQMGHIRLGKRTENRQPLLRNFLPLAELDDIVCGGWDIFEDSIYAAALKAGVLDRVLLDELKPALDTIRPLPAVFDNYYVKKLDGPHIKRGLNKMELAEALIQDMTDFVATSGCKRVVMIWCGSTEIFMQR